MSKPIAVLTADVHYNISTLPLADAAMREAIKTANELNLPFIVAGDLHDTKASLRGECIKAMIDTFSEVTTRVIVLVGNHCRINEKSEAHSLEFLRPYAEIVQTPVFDKEIATWLLPYFSDTMQLLGVLSDIPEGSRIIMHQGVQGAWMGHYVQDKSSLPNDAFADFRVISGHYHRAQSIECGPIREGGVGLFSYIGTPYTMSFAEANDGPKGFQILFDDGTMQQVPLSLRKHVVIETKAADIGKSDKWPIGHEDLLWLKVKGTRAELDAIDKVELGAYLIGHANFKLDKICEDGPREEIKAEQFTDEQLFDKLIDNTNEEPEQKAYLKVLWREVLK